MASNADYTFQQVMNGIGSYNEAGNTGPWSEGVEQLQEYLIEIGYTIENTLGFFLSDTTKAVKQFQHDCGIREDGDAGQDTCTRLFAVHSSEYFKDYGWPIDNSQWGLDNILAGKFNNVDLLARIILAESGYINQNLEKGVAIVLRNRVVNPNVKLYQAPSKDYPDASIYARVVGNGHYSTAKNETVHKDALTPQRGYKGTKETGYIGPAWKMAVDLAKYIINGTEISVTGYMVCKGDKNKGEEDVIIKSSTITVNTTNNKDYLNQQAWSIFEGNYEKGKVSAAVQPLTFSMSKGCDVIFYMP